MVFKLSWQKNFTIMYRLIIILLFLSMSACATVSVDRYEDIKRPSKSHQEHIKITDLNNENRKFQTIALVVLKVSDIYTPNMALKKLRKVASEIGGDALSDITQKRIPKKFPTFLDWLNFYKDVWTAEVLVWKN